MGSGSSTTTTSHNRKVAEKKDGTPIHVGDTLVWYEQYRDVWRSGEVVLGKEKHPHIQGTGWWFNQLVIDVAEGRIKPEHIVVVNREDVLKRHETEYVT